MNIIIPAFVLSACLLFMIGCVKTTQAITIPQYIADSHKSYLKTWLSTHPNYRIAIETDCQYCGDSIERIRKQAYGAWKPLPNYQPYYTVGDFNSDSIGDFAVAVIDDRKANGKFLILVFNGPLNPLTQTDPAFVSRTIDLSNAGMFYGSPRPMSWRLLVGPFESEGTLLIPIGKTYRWEDH